MSTKKVKTTRKQKTETKSSDAPDIRWDVTLPKPRRHWWITTAQVIVVLWLVALLVLLQQYGFALVLFLGFTAYLSTRQRTDEHHSYRLRGRTLQEDGKELHLEQFKAFRLLELPDNTADHLSAAVVLTSRRFASLGQTIYLPHEVESAETVIEALSVELVVVADAELEVLDRIVSGLARLTQLC